MCQNKEKTKTKCNPDLFRISASNAEKPGLVLKTVKSDSIIQTIAEMFSALSDLMRLKILIALSQSELCVCEIARLTGLSPFVTSHQLRFLRTLLIVKYQCSGKYAYYSLDDDYVLDMIRLMADHRQEGRQ